MHKLLCSSYPSFISFNEPFNHELHDIASMYPEVLSHNDVIVKNHIFNLVNMRVANRDMFNNYISQMDYTIALRRRNLFETALSKAIAITTNQWEANNIIGITITKELFNSCLYEVADNYVMFRNNPLKFHFDEVIYYEDINGDATDYDLVKICKERHYDRVNVRRSMEKHNQVTNYYDCLQWMYEFIDNNVQGIVFDGLLATD